MSGAATSGEVVFHKSLRQSVPTTIDLKRLPAHAAFMRILGVNYVRLMVADSGDLYVTEYGLPFIKHLDPANWYEQDYFKKHAERLEGTSAVYRIATRPLKAGLCRSIQVVVKWSRVGQDVPLDTFTLNKVINAEFNTPFEEFSLVEEVRAGRYGPPHLRIPMQKPLAIFVPPEQMQLWQSGRSIDKIRTKIARHPAVEIDICRSYILLYGWIDGLNAVQAYRNSYYDLAAQQVALHELTDRVARDLQRKGFLVADHKPTHCIVRMHDDGQLVRGKDRLEKYALIDYELLARTPEHEDAVRSASRSTYLQRQRDRFLPRHPSEFPPHLKPASVMGVDYVYGSTESTHGALWVVGNDPELFNYFLPERWRTKQVRLSPTSETYYTQTKDRIHLVWKVSRVGELPSRELGNPAYQQVLQQGYNAPFEEIAAALELHRSGIHTTYPRAIYMTGRFGNLDSSVIDTRRFERFADRRSPADTALLPSDRDYITLWGYWRGFEDGEAIRDTAFWTPIDGDRAVVTGLIAAADLEDLLARHVHRLAAAGFRDASLRGSHVILSYIPPGTFKRDADGQIEVRHCNFETVCRIG